MLPLLGGCWAIDEAAANRRSERALSYGAPVQANGISALTPTPYLLVEKAPNGLTLNNTDGFYSYSALHNKLSAFDGIVARDRKNAAVFKTFRVECRGSILDIHMARYNQGESVKLIYYTYFGSPDDGISAEYIQYFQDTAFKGEPWWDMVPDFFVRFLNSIQYKASATAGL